MQRSTIPEHITKAFDEGRADRFALASAEIERVLRSDPRIVRKVGENYKLGIATKDGVVRSWTVDLLAPPGIISEGARAGPAPKCSMRMDETDFLYVARRTFSVPRIFPRLASFFSAKIRLSRQIFFFFAQTKRRATS